jgi:hypothetical protein
MAADHGAEGVKNGLAQGLVGAEMQTAFPELYRRRADRLLALWSSRRYISVEFPDIASGV